MRTLLLDVHHLLGSRWLRQAGLACWLLAWLVAVVLLLTPLNVPGPDSADKLGHLLLFGALAFAAVAFCRDTRHLAWSAGFTLLGSYLLELGQLLVPSRRYEGMDVLANGSGAAIGFVLALVVVQVLQRAVRTAGQDGTQET